MDGGSIAGIVVAALVATMTIVFVIVSKLTASREDKDDGPTSASTSKVHSS